MNSIWSKIAGTLDQKFYNVFQLFWKDKGVHEYRNPWRREQNIGNDGNNNRPAARENNRILEIYLSGLLDYLAQHYHAILAALNEAELFLLLLITNLLSISLSPHTRERLNAIDCKKMKMGFAMLFNQMMQAETRKEYSKRLTGKSGFKEVTEQYQNYRGRNEELSPIVMGGKTEYSEEECYQDYCALVRRMLAEDDNIVFLDLYNYYHDIRGKIEQGMYPRWYSTGSDDIILNPDNFFVTDSTVCKHFRLSCMLNRQGEDETVVLKWKDVLKYPSIHEILVEKRAAGLLADKDSYSYFLSRKMDMLNALWISDYKILQEYRIRAEQKLGEYHYEDLSDAWKEKGKKLSAHMNMSSVQERYDRYLEGEARIAINSCMEDLDKLLSEHQEIKDAEELAQVGEKVEKYCQSRYAGLIETIESDDGEESCSALYMELWPQDDLYRQVEISDNEMYVQRYYLSDYLLNTGEDGEGFVDFHIRQVFEEQLLLDVEKIMKFWLNHSLTLTKKIICEL